MTRYKLMYADFFHGYEILNTVAYIDTIKDAIERASKHSRKVNKWVLFDMKTGKRV
jgi:hypothetical protein